MSKGLRFAHLAALVGKKNGARWGARRVTIGAVGINSNGRWVMGEFTDGSVVVGPPEDFNVPKTKGREGRR